ncbi:MAG: hypothetical protein LC792_06700, partial [Actinobacteria bacterium]|nr:hypothetical protein [Actinomycetota bacterium]
MAVLIVSMAAAAPLTRSTEPMPVREVLLTAEILTLILSVAVLLAPTWKTPPEPVVTLPAAAVTPRPWHEETSTSFEVPADRVTEVPDAVEFRVKLTTFL